MAFQRESSILLWALGLLLYCEGDDEEAVRFLRRAFAKPTQTTLNTAILAACVPDTEASDLISSLIDQFDLPEFWSAFLKLCDVYAPFGKIVARMSDLVLKRDSSNQFARLHRAVAFAQLDEFPRATVAL